MPSPRNQLILSLKAKSNSHLPGEKMEEPPSERTRPYESIFESQCRCATSELLKAAKFMSEDSDRRVFHRFDELRVFVLLRLQHRLAAMATQLEKLRREQDKRNDEGDIDGVKDEVLNDLAVDIGRVLKDYGNSPTFGFPC
jgi:hypothetical protein